MITNVTYTFGFNKFILNYKLARRYSEVSVQAVVDVSGEQRGVAEPSVTFRARELLLLRGGGGGPGPVWPAVRGY